MNASTRTAVAAILEADTSIPKEDIAAAMKILSGEKPRPFGRVIRTGEAARICGVTTKTLRNWEKSGLLVSIKRPDCKCRTGYTEESIRAALSGQVVRREGGAA